MTERQFVWARPQPHRWAEQRWALNNIIQANGLDWDQPRSLYWNAPCGVSASADFAMVRERVKKYDDISTEFVAQAKRRQRQAEAAAATGEAVSARENYFFAAIHWGAAQWPINERNAENLQYNEQKLVCYRKYSALADHFIEEVRIPLGAQHLTAWLHLPAGYSGGRVPVIVSIPGMDSFKEASVAMYGDPFLSRGFAVLAIEGPGQYEAPLNGVFLTMEAWEATGPACVEWLLLRGEIDAERIAVTGRSFGSFAALIVAASEPRFSAVAVSAACFEPGFESICQSASPTFKKRLMFMANYADEAAFDEFRQTLTWRDAAPKIRVPFQCIAGQSDELSPLTCAEALFNALPAARRLVVYEKSRHSVGSGVPSAELGPNINALSADWLEARFMGKPFVSERWFVDSHGVVSTSSF